MIQAKRKQAKAKQLADEDFEDIMSEHISEKHPGRKSSELFCPKYVKILIAIQKGADKHKKHIMEQYRKYVQKFTTVKEKREQAALNRHMRANTREQGQNQARLHRSNLQLI